jgi:hypothetical protein
MCEERIEGSFGTHTHPHSKVNKHNKEGKQYTHIIHEWVVASIGHRGRRRIVARVDVEEGVDAAGADSSGRVGHAPNALHAESRKVSAYKTYMEIGLHVSAIQRGRWLLKPALLYGARTVVIDAIDKRRLRDAPPEALEVVVEQARNANVAHTGVPFAYTHYNRPEKVSDESANE